MYFLLATGSIMHERHQMQLKKFTLSFQVVGIVGVYAGIYIDQNYTVIQRATMGDTGYMTYGPCK